jgi:hypothetical protein
VYSARVFRGWSEASLTIAVAALLACSVDGSAIYPSDGSSPGDTPDARGGRGSLGGAGGIGGIAGAGPLSGVGGVAEGDHGGETSETGEGGAGTGGGEAIDAAAGGTGGLADGAGGGATDGGGGTGGRGGGTAGGGAGSGPGGRGGGSAGAGSGGIGGGGAGTGGVAPCSVYPGAQAFAPPGKTAHCYWFHAPRYRWPDAEYTCESEGGKLASSLSSAENSFLVQLATTSSPVATTYWLGGTDGRASSDNGSGSFTWVTGDPFTYRNWAADQPDGHCDGCLGAGPLGCVCEHRIALGSDGTWSDEWDGSIHPFICEATP